ncbi:single-stranded DNA-binding protein [Candidatus Dependentiae bacterium]
MSGYNRIIIMGNLTRDPESKQLPSGQSLCKIGLAVSRKFKSKQTDDWMEEVCFVDVDVWGIQAENCSKYLEKGNPVLVEGRLKLDTWQDQEGQKRSKHSIVADRVTFVRAMPQENVATKEEKAEPAKKIRKSAPKAEKKDDVDFEDDLPF